MIDKLRKIALHSKVIHAQNEQELASEKDIPTPDDMKRLALELPIQDEPELHVDANGVPIMLFAPDALRWPWSKNQADKLIEIMSDATLELSERYPPNFPNPRDIRHINPAKERDQHKSFGRVSGTYHLGLDR